LSDIFREVEEDVRRERLEKFWKRYGVWLIALAVLLLAGVGGWQLWQRQQAAERMRMSDAFAAAQRISDPRSAATAFAELAKTSKGGYVQVAKMAQAGALFASGQLKPAVDTYKDVGQTDSGEIGKAARLRAAWIIASTAPRKELEDLLAPLNQDGSVWQTMAREILAFSDFRASRIKQAADGYRALVEDERSPQALRARARAMAAFLDNGAGTDVGTVPATPDVAALPAAIPAPAAAQ